MAEDYKRLLEEHFKEMQSDLDVVKNGNKKLYAITRDEKIIKDVYSDTTSPLGESPLLDEAIDKHVNDILMRAIRIGRTKAMKTMNQYLTSVKNKK